MSQDFSVTNFATKFFFRPFDGSYTDRQVEQYTADLAYLHHEEDGVEDDEGHDEVLEGGGYDHSPQLVLEAVSLTRHVALQRLRIDREVNAGLLKIRRGKILLKKESTLTVRIQAS